MIKNFYKRILGIDIGYGDVKFSYRNENGEIVYFKFSSVVAEAPIDAEDMPLLEKCRYFLGENALLRDSNSIIEITNYEYLSKFAPLFLWKAMEILNIKAEDIDLIVTGLSLAQVTNAKHFMNRLSKFSINNEKYNFTDKIKLVPQGVGAKYAIDYFYKGIENISLETFLIIDIGFSTIDVVDVMNSTVRKENLKGYENEGIIKIARSLQEHLVAKYNVVVSLKEAKEIMYTCQYVEEGNIHSVSDFLETQAFTYTEHTVKILRSRYEREFKKYPKIFFVGGGSHFIDPSVSKIIEVVKDPEYYNSIGNLLFGEKELGVAI